MIGNSRSSIAVTTPKLPPPPRKAQNRSISAGVGAEKPAVGGDDLDRLDVVGRQPIGAAQPAHPAADRVPDHADVRRGARQRGQAVLGRRLATSRQTTPASARAILAARSMITCRIRSVLTRTVSASGRAAPSVTGPWRRPADRRARNETSATSARVSSATAASWPQRVQPSASSQPDHRQIRVGGQRGKQSSSQRCQIRRAAPAISRRVLPANLDATDESPGANPPRVQISASSQPPAR